MLTLEESVLSNRLVASSFYLVVDNAMHILDFGLDKGCKKNISL